MFDQCLSEPQHVQYRGGKLINPKFDHGLHGWNGFGGSKIEIRRSSSRNNFMVAYNRSGHNETISQKIFMDKGHYYTFSGI